MKRWWLSSLLFGAAVAWAPPADAGCGCGTWGAPPVTLNQCLKETTVCLPSGWDAPAQGALWEWNQFVDLFRIRNPRLDQIAWADQLNSLAWLDPATTQSRYGVAVGPSTLAVTFTIAQPGLSGNATCPSPAGRVATHKPRRTSSC